MAGKWFSPQGFIRFYGMGHHSIGRQRRNHPCFRAGKDVPTRQTDGVTSLEWGLANSGRVITSAALIMVAVFSSFVLNGDPVVKQFGVGLAFAVAIDATVVRCLLVPAVMVLMKRLNWWFPHWLDRAVPKVDIEGNEYFDKLEADAR